MPYVDGNPINLVKLCPPGKEPARFEITTLQVDTNKKNVHKGEIAKADCQSLCSTAILKELNSMKGSNADKIKLSIDNQVLHNLTALIASEKLMDSTSKETILVNIPMNKPK